MKDVVNRMHVAMPQARDKLARPPVIPSGVAQARAAREGGFKVPTEKDLQVSCRLDTKQGYLTEGPALIKQSARQSLLALLPQPLPIDYVQCTVMVLVYVQQRA